jgi:TolA-binding protein
MKKNVKNVFFSILIFGIITTFSGCIVTTNEITDLKTELSQLKSEMSALKRNQAELNSKMDLLNTNLQVYTEKLEENKYKMSILAQRMDDVYSSITQRMDILSKQLPKVDTSILPLPTELFQVAYNDYVKGMYDLSIRGFKDYLEKYPDSELASKAYYYLADSYLVKKQYNESIKVIDEYISKYQKDELLPTMLYKKSQCFIALSLPKQAKEIQDYILKNYPNSKEAQNIKSSQ